MPAGAGESQMSYFKFKLSQKKFGTADERG